MSAPRNTFCEDEESFDFGLPRGCTLISPVTPIFVARSFSACEGVNMPGIAMEGREVGKVVKS